MTEKPRKKRAQGLPLYLEADLYEQLCAIAEQEDRDPIQQARHFIRKALTTAQELPKFVPDVIEGERP